MMIVLGAGRLNRTSLGRFLPWSPRRQVSPFTSRGWGGTFCPPPLLLLPRDPQGLPVWAERVDAWLRPPVLTSRTGGALSLPQYRSRN